MVARSQHRQTGEQHPSQVRSGTMLSQASAVAAETGAEQRHVTARLSSRVIAVGTGTATRATRATRTSASTKAGLDRAYVSAW
jgi:hypothetical protein